MNSIYSVLSRPSKTAKMNMDLFLPSIEIQIQNSHSLKFDLRGLKLINYDGNFKKFLKGLYDKYFEDFISVLNGFKNIKKAIEHTKNFESSCSSIEELKEKSQSLNKKTRIQSKILTKCVVGAIENNIFRILMAINDVTHFFLLFV